MLGSCPAHEGQLESKLKLHVLAHSRCTAQDEVDLELLGPLVADRLAGALLLFGAQATGDVPNSVAGLSRWS